VLTMWWCLDQTATATRTSRQLLRPFTAARHLLPWLPISAVDKTNLYPGPGIATEHRGPFWLWIFAFSPGPRAGDDTTTNGLALSFSFHSSRHATIISISMLDPF
jgi:hypothetical protein